MFSQTSNRGRTTTALNVSVLFILNALADIELQHEENHRNVSVLFTLNSLSRHRRDSRGQLSRGRTITIRGLSPLLPMLRGECSL